MAKLEAGTTAPAFTLHDHDGKPVKLSDFKGRQVIVYFYPADDTPGCTKEACQFNDNLKTFEKAGVAVRGLAPSPVSTDATWTKLTPSANRKLAYRRPPGRSASRALNTFSINAWFSSALSDLVL